MTLNQFDRTARMLVDFAGEDGKVVQRGSSIYYEGSELATLRLLKKYRLSTNARQGFSTNLGTFYFVIDC